MAVGRINVIKTLVIEVGKEDGCRALAMIGQKLDCAKRAIHLAHIHGTFLRWAPLSIHLFNHDGSLRNDGHWKLNVPSEQVDFDCEIERSL